MDPFNQDDRELGMDALNVVSDGRLSENLREIMRDKLHNIYINYKYLSFRAGTIPQIFKEFVRLGHLVSWEEKISDRRQTIYIDEEEEEAADAALAIYLDLAMEAFKRTVATST